MGLFNFHWDNDFGQKYPDFFVLKASWSYLWYLHTCWQCDSNYKTCLSFFCSLPDLSLSVNAAPWARTQNPSRGVAVIVEMKIADWRSPVGAVATNTTLQNRSYRRMAPQRNVERWQTGQVGQYERHHLSADFETVKFSLVAVWKLSSNVLVLIHFRCIQSLFTLCLQ